MRTLVLSDLHLGGRAAGADVLRRPELRTGLLEAVAEVDRVVLLGDVIELRDGPAREALNTARGFLAALGEAAGDREVVLVPGNHDHALISPWLERRARLADPLPLSLEERVPAREASELAAIVEEHLGGQAGLTVAYPGLWLRPDVWATHGHYLDRHITVPSFERLAARGVERVVRGPARTAGAPADYEASFGPVYALLYAAAQIAPPQAGQGTSGASARAWRLLAGDGRRRLPTLPQLAALVAYPLAITGLRAAGLGPLDVSLSGAGLRRAGIAAMGEVVERLAVPALHVIFGHTHRAGPGPSDDAGEWVTPSGARLYNAGCWVHDPLFLGQDPVGSPYAPGRALIVGADGPPSMRRLLELDARELPPI